MKNLNKVIQIIILFFFTVIITNCDLSETSKPKNVILFISDGCGFNHVDAASYYQYGKTGMQVYEQFPVKLAMSTYLANGFYDPDSAWANFNYVKRNSTGSAASITAISTGVKSYRGSICFDTLKHPLVNLSDIFEKEGKSTGAVSTVPFGNATPAGVIAHNVNRQNYKEITKEMILESKADVIIGGGHPFYNPDGSLVSELAERFVGSKEIWDMNNGGKPISSEDGKLLEESEFRYVGGKEVWDALSNGTAGSDGANTAEAHPLINGVTDITGGTLSK